MNSCGFHERTQTYLSCFYEILGEMIRGMCSAELTDSVSQNFIVQMIPHHRAAIEMSRNVLNYTTLAPLQQIASRIITEQTRSIQDMEAALCACSTMENTQLCREEYLRRFQEITRTMFTRMGTACATNQISANFMREMIPHHRGAIQMSESALRCPVCPELKPILQAIITSQKAGVREMECLLRRITR